MQKDTWFSKEEIISRLEKIQVKLKENNLEFLLAFEPETITYLTGYFTNAYTTFQFAVIPAHGEPTVVFRDVEEYYFKMRCVFDKFDVWRDQDNPTDVMVRVVKSLLGKTRRVALEKGSWQLTGARYEALQQNLPGAEFIDVTQMTREIRYIKSPAEISLQRQAGKAAEAGMAAALKACKPGASERDVAAAVCAAMILAGSDYPGPGVLSSGERAKHLHGSYSDRILEVGDTVQMENTPCVKFYNARFMRTIKVQKATPEEQDLMATIISIQDCALKEVGPGVPAAIPDTIIRDAIKAKQLAENYTNRTFYSVGFLLRPNGMETLLAAPGCTWKFQPGMTFHTYLLLKGFGFSETITITETGYDLLTNFPRKLLVSEA